MALQSEGSTTFLPMCAEIQAVPHDTDEYRATAAHLGYGEDTTAMARHHDAIHCALADWLGLPCSPTLATVGGRPIGDAVLHGLEEDAVMAVARFANAAGVDVQAWLRKRGGA